jgi:uncharacterized repeat protein (TIGR02543 family)
MVLTIVLVAGMVGTNKADADDNSSNVIEDLSSKIQIKKQPVNYTYLNKGSEGQDFAPVFSFDVEVPKLSSPYHYAFCQWQIKQAGAENWTDIVWDKETKEDEAHNHGSYDDSDTATKHKLKFTETFAITGDRLRDARGSEYRCVIMLYSFNPSETDYYENLVGTVVTDSVKVDYQCQVTFLNRNGNHSKVGEVKVPYNTKLDLANAISGKIITSVEEKTGNHSYTAFNTNTAITYGRTLYVKTSDAVTVTFKLGEGHGEDIVKKIAKGTTVAEPEIPEQNGYVVTSWYTTNPNTPYNFNNIVYSNLTLNAVWSKYGIEITEQPKDYPFQNNGNEYGFAPKFTFKAQISNVRHEADYKLVYKWEEKYENDEDWTVSKITQGDSDNKVDSDKIYRDWTSDSIEVSLPLSTEGDEGGIDVARKGKLFRCTVQIVKHTNDGDVVIAASEPTNAVRCVYTCRVNFYNRNSYSYDPLATAYIEYGKTVTIPESLQKENKQVLLYTWNYGRYTAIDPSETVITEAKNLYVDYKDIKFTVDFDMNGHGTKPQAQTVTPGGHATRPVNDPTAEGWKFEGWYTTAAGDTEFNFGATAINADTTVYAKWTKLVKVTFTHNGRHGYVEDDIYWITRGSTITRPDPDPECTFDKDHTFLNWYADSAFTTLFDFTKGIDVDTIIYAKWGYLVDFDLNGHGGDLTIEPQKFVKGELVTEPTPAPTDDKYEFTGWYTNQNCTTKFLFNGTMNKIDNKGYTLYAGWKEKTKVMVTFDMKGHGTQVESQSFYAGGTATQPEDPKEEGYTFGGWFSDEDCKNSFKWDTPISTNTIIYAKWTQITFKVTFELNGHGAPQPQNQTVAKGGFATEPDDAPTDNNYKFDGWYTKRNGGQKFNFATMAINENTTIYAHWTKKSKVTVTFEMNGHGTQITQRIINEGDKVTKPNDPKADDYRFDGWFADKDLKTPFNFDQAINQNTKIYAKWTQTHVTVTFLAEPGTDDRHGYEDGIIATVKVAVGSTISEDQIPQDVVCGNNTSLERSGIRHDFDDWYSNPERTTKFDFTKAITKNTTVYANWFTYYKVTFDGNNKINKSVDPQWVLKGQKASEPTGVTPKDETHEFIGWFNGNSTKAFDFANTKITGAITLKAKTKEAEKVYSLDSDYADKQYFVNDELSVTNLKIVVKQGTKETEIDVTKDMVSGFDSSKAAKDLLLTVTYAGKEFYYTVDVNRLEGEISFDDEVINLTYGETMTLTVDSHGEEILIASGNETFVKVVDGKLVAVKVGETTITLTAPQTDTHEKASISVPIVVSAKEIELVWSDIEPVEYDGKTHKPSAVVKEGDLVGADKVVVLVEGEGRDAGKYTATASIENKNYVIKDAFVKKEFVITAKKLNALTISFAKMLCGDIYGMTKVEKPNVENMLVQILREVNGTDGLILSTNPISSNSTFVTGDVIDFIPTADMIPLIGYSWPEMKLGQLEETSVRITKLYELTLEDIKDAFENGGSQPTPYTDAVVGGKTYVLELQINHSNNVEYPTNQPFVVTIDGKQANCYVGVTDYATWLFVEFVPEHIPGEEHEENRVEPKCLVDGSVDMVVRCTACEKVLSSEAKVLDKTDHDWDVWKIVEDADYTKPGKMVRICKNDSEHKEEKEIPQLTNEIVKMQIVIPDTVKKEYKIGEKLNIDGLKIEFTWKDGSKTEIPVTADMVTGFDSMKATDAQELTVKYKDADGAYTIKVKKDTSIFYTITGSLVWVRGTNMNPIVHRNVDDWITFSLFKGFKIGGKVPPVSAYIAKSGSLDLTIMNEYLETLEPGEYDLTIEFEDGEVSAKITVPEAAKKEEEKPVDDQPVEPKKEESKTPESPKTADTAQTFVWTILLAIAVAAMIAVVVYRRRREDAE